MACVICTSSMPMTQRDVSLVFFAGIVHAAAHTILGERLPELCEEHTKDLRELLETRELRLAPHDDHFHLAGKDEEVSFDEPKEPVAK